MKRSELFFAFLLIPIDMIAVIIAFVFAYYLRTQIETSTAFSAIGISEYLRYGFYLLPIWIGLNALNGLYSIRNYTGPAFEFYRIFLSASTAILCLIVIIFFAKTLFFSRIILVLIWLTSILAVFIARMVLKCLQRTLLAYFDLGRRNILLIGSAPNIDEIAMRVKRELRFGFSVVGTVLTTENKDCNTKIIGCFDNIAEILNKKEIDEVIFADSNLTKDKLSNLVRLCDDKRISFKYIPDDLAIMTSSFKPGLAGSIPVMELRPIPLDGWGRIAKRFFDVFFSAIFLAILSPIGLLIALFIKLTSRGPVFYRHQRVSRDEIVFDFYKFRSMYIDKCDFKGGIYWTTAEDEKTRVTPIGKILRKTNLDELPQLWNILLGEMSFVGPRPELPKLVEKFEKEIPDYFRRHKVKTGLTGWAQVNGLKGDTSVSERVKYDLYYIENWSLWFDLKIIIKTFWLVVYEAILGKSEYRART
ncbi:MAG: sugar transferase [Patescibacteria group bacterium]